MVCTSWDCVGNRHKQCIESPLPIAWYRVRLSQSLCDAVMMVAVVVTVEMMVMVVMAVMAVLVVVTVVRAKRGLGWQPLGMAQLAPYTLGQPPSWVLESLCIEVTLPLHRGLQREAGEEG